MEYTKPFDFELKQLADEDEPGMFEGYISTFKNIDRQGDIVMPGAFDRTLKETKGRVPVLMGHVMARIVGFGISAEVDQRGVKVRGQFTMDSDEGRNAAAVARHALKLKHPLGMSIGYGIAEGGAEQDARGIRKLKDIDLFEYSIAAVQSNSRAHFTGIKGAMWSQREFEEYLRDAGLSREAAKRFVLRGYGGLNDQRDADGGGKGADTAFTAELRELRDYITLIGA
jgi:HK97 family phage prohead protease